MASPIDINPEYTIDDMGVKTSDRPDYCVGDHRFISSPYFRDLYYVRGYNDVLTATWREDKGKHPDNEAAYYMGRADAEGDLNS